MRSTHLIYCLKCPFTEEIHYIGRTTQGMRRPLQHLTKSHSDRVNEWVTNLKELGYRPIIEILEDLTEVEEASFNIETLNEREAWWINHYVQEGAYLLNINLVTPILNSVELEEDVSYEINIEEISNFVRQRRRLVGLTQEEFADRAGIALTVIRKIEQGKTNVNLGGLLTVLKMFGCSVKIKRN